MKLKDFAISRRGNAAELAKKIGVLPPVMYDWANGKRPVPVQWCIPIEQATSGQVTRQDLRPKDYHLIWPELQKEAV